MSYTIRTMRRDEVGWAVEWAAQEGWNPGRHDAACYFEADPDGFLMGFLDGEPIASLSAIRYDDAFGFIGFYIVKSEYRGKGYGMQLWNAGLRYLDGLNIGLDGVLAQQDNYKKSGFKLAYRNIRYEGRGGGTAPQDERHAELSTMPFETIEAYEQPFFPASRSAFLKAWIRQPDSHALGVVTDDHLSGYGVIRACRTGYKIGPLFADTPEIAESLFIALKSTASASDSVFLDVPDAHPAAVALAEKYKMVRSFETARMYTGPFPGLPFGRLFGVTSFEIG